MSSNPRRLDPVEKLEIQTEALVALQQSVGVDHSKEMVDRAVYEMADRLWMLKEALLEAEMKKARRLATSLAAVSKQIGLTDFSRVARDLRNCIDAENTVAIAAVGDRLQRVGEGSLFFAAEFQQNA